MKRFIPMGAALFTLLLTACQSAETKLPDTAPPDAKPQPAQQATKAAPTNAALPCEPSALYWDSATKRLLVADNEIKNKLFIYKRNDADTAWQAADPPTFSWPGANKKSGRMEDLEALTKAQGKWVLVSSSSRGKYKEGACPTKNYDRLRVQWVDPTGAPGVMQSWGAKTKKKELIQARKTSLQSVEACLENLFVPALRQDPLATQLCAELHKTEAAANRDAKTCAQTFNIEGATTHNNRVWLGLRAPDFGAHGVLLRLVPPSPGAGQTQALRFDGVAQVEWTWYKNKTWDTPTLGIRELEATPNALRGIAGPLQDIPAGETGIFTLWEAPLADLKHGALLQAKPIPGPPLPMSTEGMAHTTPTRVTFVIDGDGKDPKACAAPGQWHQRALPTPQASKPPIPYIEALTAGAKPSDPLPLIVAVHGLGDNPKSFIKLVNKLDFPARVIAPQGLTPRGRGFSWFPASGGDFESLAPKVKIAADKISDLITWLKAHKNTQGVAITGFSQGGMLSFAVAAQHPDQIDLAVPLAGMLPQALMPKTSHTPPICALHGDSDKRIPMPPTRITVQALQKQGWNSKLKTYPGVGHGVPMLMRRDLHDTLRRGLTQSVDPCPTP